MPRRHKAETEASESPEPPIPRMAMHGPRHSRGWTTAPVSLHQLHPHNKGWETPAPRTSLELAEGRSRITPRNEHAICRKELVKLLGRGSREARPLRGRPLPPIFSRKDQIFSAESFPKCEGGCISTSPQPSRIPRATAQLSFK